ncbi:hypothetical protein E0H63_07120 [Rhizobium leguminosarum bv. viciae]|nr:hypothetical protein E0H63_07120 [Rhizobium leguminosarum bv. viciae]
MTSLTNRQITWWARLALAANSAATRPARNEVLGRYQNLTPEKYQSLLSHIEAEIAGTRPVNIPDEIFEYYFSSEAMLAHPLLVSYIRPSIRFVESYGFDFNGTPIIASPALTFGGQAVPLDADMKVAEIPLGLVFLFREVGRAILNLHNSIAMQRVSDVRSYARICAEIAELLYKPAAKVYEHCIEKFRPTSLKSKLFSAQTTQVIAVFVILHEAGHICLRHNLDEVSPAQEFAADIFAVEAFRSAKRDPKFNVFYDLALIFVCDLFSIMELEFTVNGGSLLGYPSFSERRDNLLSHFKPPPDVTAAIEAFGVEITRFAMQS